MSQNHLKKLSRLVLAVFLAGFTIAACNNKKEEKKDPPKTDTPAAKPATDPATPAPDDTTGNGGEVPKEKPTAPADKVSPGGGL